MSHTFAIGRRGLLAGAAVLAAATPAFAADLKIGVDLSLTGGTDDFGKGSRMGIELATNEFNAAGGYKGQKVELVIYDDETKPAKGVENVTRLITRDRVCAIIGPANSGVALAVIDIAQKQKIPLMVPLPTAEMIIGRYAKEPKHYIFRVSLNDGIQTQFMIDFIIGQLCRGADNRLHDERELKIHAWRRGRQSQARLRGLAPDWLGCASGF